MIFLILRVIIYSNIFLQEENMKMNTRRESDSVGALDIPENAYYGVQTLRGFQNFQISGAKVNDLFIKNITLIKKAAAKVNAQYGYIDEKIAEAICTACDEILQGKLREHFITDAIQGGAGTTANMNVNEVVANRASELLGGVKGLYICHPNDHVNEAQSTNDVIPTAGKLTVLELAEELLSALDDLVQALSDKAVELTPLTWLTRRQPQTSTT